MKKIFLAVILIAIVLMGGLSLNNKIVSNSDEKKDIKSEILTLDDISKLSDAIKSNNKESLTDEKDKFVFDEVKRIIDSKITDNMSVYEKELAVHDYIVKNCEYDPDKLNPLKRKENENSDSPYGVLKRKRAICLGYAKTFQLFMNVLDIPCITIHATATDEEHGWNMVQIDNKWYHVDVTWDDPVPDKGSKVSHKYFNVTDSFIEKDHNWDKKITPVADSKKFKYKK